MYINFKLLIGRGLSATDMLILQGIKQKEHALFSKSEAKLNQLLILGYLTTIKGTKKQPLYTKYRLSQKGKIFLRDLEVADLTDDVKQLAADLMGIYEASGIPEKIGNKKKVVELVSWFVNETQFEGQHIIECVSDYVTSNEPQYTSKLNNLLWMGESVFSTNWNLSQSKLYTIMKS